MTRFFTAIALCGGLLAVGLFMFMPSAEAQNTPLPMLLAVPAPPPPNPVWRPEITTRDENFYDKKNPPSDNASTSDLLDYWKTQNQFDPKYVYTAEPSPKTVERLMSEIEKKPEMLPDLVNNFPESRETAEFVKKIYDDADSNGKFDPQWRVAVKRWLTYHSNYYSDDLYETASAATDSGGYVTNQDELLALARVDFERARPLLDRMLADSSKPISQTLARWAYYKNAMASGDSLTADQYRRSLQQTVEDKTAGPGNRDLAMDAIVETGDFSGRDDWYLGLLEDETLHDLRVGGQTYTGLTTIINHSPNDKYVDKMIELTSSPNKIVRTAVVRNLNTMIAQGVKKPEIVRALLPWLEDPEWVKANPNERSQLVLLLGEFEVPESVPGLIALLNEKQIDESQVVDVAPSTANAPRIKRSGDVKYIYPFRSAAINALLKQKSSAAAGPLRQILPFVEDYERPNLVKTILVCGGFSLNEQITALELFAKNASIDENIPANMPATNAMPMISGTVLKAPPLRRDETVIDGPVSETRGPSPIDGVQLNQLLGMFVAQIEDPSNELVKAVIDRIALHEKRNPKLATSLRAIIQNWKGPAINSLMLSDLRDGRSNASELVKLLAIRKQLRETQLDEVNGIRAGNPTALGISACLLESSGDYDAILDGDSIESKVALLACARLIRAPLSIEKVAALTTANNDLLKIAAERYLISEDSPAARRIVLALHPKDAMVLGATFGFNEEGSGVELDDVKRLFASVDELYSKFEPYMIGMANAENESEIALRKEVKSDPNLLGVYAFDGNFVRIFADRAMFSWSDDPARYRERQLSGEEFEALKNFLTSQRVDELTPFLSPCDGCENKELLMLGKAGGRRVFLRADPLPPFFTELTNIFNEFRREAAPVHYYLEKDIKGLEVLFADDAYDAVTIWKNGPDFRLLVQDAKVRKQQETGSLSEEEFDGGDGGDEEPAEETPAEKAAREKSEREERLKQRQKEFESFSWFRFADGKLAEPTTQPDGAPYIPVIDSFAAPATNEQWKSRAGNVEVRVAEDGLYKIQNGQMTQMRTGTYYHPIVTPNGRWAIVTKFSDPANENFEPASYRVNLATNRETRLNIQSEYNTPEAVAFIPQLGKVLMFSGYGEEETEFGPRSGEYFLLDPETGVAVPFNGEGSPIMQQSFRPLQPVGTSTEFVWAALPAADESVTAIGVYSMKTLTFKPLVKLPKIAFDSMSMWVEDAEQKIYIVYRGQLISIPLPKTK